MTRRRLLPGGLLLLAILSVAGPGCTPAPRVLSPAERKTIDRSVVEYPAGFEFQRYIANLTGPSSIAFDDEGSILIAEAGHGDRSPQIFGFRPDGTRFNIYNDARLPFGIGSPRRKIYGPIGGLVYHDRKVYVTHRDRNGKGVITAFGYDGTRKTIVAGMPAQGDHGLTDLAVAPNGRLYFGIGTATNSGVVGIDNWQVGWVRKHPNVRDLPWTKLRLGASRFDSRNPLAGLFGPGEKAVTGPFQPFDKGNQSWVYEPRNGKFNGAIYSVALDGGDLRAEASGIRLPRGLAFNNLGTLYFTNNGMELRGTRPVKDDPDVLCKLVPTWYGWPDYSADFQPITDSRFFPGIDLIYPSGYNALSFLIDHDVSGRDGTGLRPPPRDALLRGRFPSQSGAAKLVMAPRTGPFERFQGSAIIALGGDRAPFATGNQKLIGPVGYKVVRVVVDNQQVEDFIRNTRGQPAHRLGKRVRQALERPVDVKFGPDGALYVLDMGRMEVKNGRERVSAGTGQIFRLVPVPTEAKPPAEAEPRRESESGQVKEEAATPEPPPKPQIVD